MQGILEYTTTRGSHTHTHARPVCCERTDSHSGPPPQSKFEDVAPLSAF